MNTNVCLLSLVQFRFLVGIAYRFLSLDSDFEEFVFVGKKGIFSSNAKREWREKLLRFVSFQGYVYTFLLQRLNIRA